MPSLLEQFESLRKKEAQKLETNAKSSSYTPDTRFVEFPVGNNEFRFRLCFSANPEIGRATPWIAQHTHAHWLEHEKKRLYAVCPSSPYLEDAQSFFKKLCPVCIEAKNQYRLKESGSASALDMYNILKRNFNVYTVVYVVKDPVNPDNNGKFKILRGGYTIYNFLQKQVLGINEDAWKNKKDDDELSANTFLESEEDIVGIDAFKLDSGFDLIVNSSPKTTKYNAYTCSFSRKATSVPITEKEIEVAYKELNFDKDFWKPWNIEDLNIFLNGVCETSITTTDEGKAVDRQSPPSTKEEKTEDVDDALSDLGLAPTKPEKQTKPTKTKKEEKVEENVEELSSPVDDTNVLDVNDLDIDALLEDL
jgi:hypothetical protein